MLSGVKSLVMGGREVWPLVEGGKGVSATNHASSGAWALAGGVGTVSAVNADSYDADGNIIPQIYRAATRRDRHEELVQYGIDGGIAQVQRAYEIAAPELQRGIGAININVLWEMGGAQRILHGVLEGTRGMVNGVTCGAGMPYKLSEIAAQYGVHYYPSSARPGHSARCGSAPIPRRPSGWARWCMKTRGWPVATTACPTPKTRSHPRIPTRALPSCAPPCGNSACPNRCRS